MQQGNQQGPSASQAVQAPTFQQQQPHPHAMPQQQQQLYRPPQPVLPQVAPGRPAHPILQSSSAVRPTYMPQAVPRPAGKFHCCKYRGHAICSGHLKICSKGDADNKYDDMISDPKHGVCFAHNMSMLSTRTYRSDKVHQVVLPLSKLPRLTSSIMNVAAAAANRTGSFMGTYKPGESLPAQKRIKKRKGPDSASIDRVSHSIQC